MFSKGKPVSVGLSNVLPCDVAARTFAERALAGLWFVPVGLVSSRAPRKAAPFVSW